MAGRLVGSGLISTGGIAVGGISAVGTQALKPSVNITIRRNRLFFIANLSFLSLSDYITCSDYFYHQACLLIALYTFPHPTFPQIRSSR